MAPWALEGAQTPWPSSAERSWGQILLLGVPCPQEAVLLGLQSVLQPAWSGKGVLAWVQSHQIWGAAFWAHPSWPVSARGLPLPWWVPPPLATIAGTSWPKDVPGHGGPLLGLCFGQSWPGPRGSLAQVRGTQHSADEFQVQPSQVPKQESEGFGESHPLASCWMTPKRTAAAAKVPLAWQEKP